jgi:protein-S-isoprenylcysteine O-methyltransferase Ste14
VAVGGVLGAAAVGQVVLAVVVHDPARTSDLLANLGWVVLWCGAVLGVLPVYTLRRQGGVPPGRGYVHTTVLVDRGLYAVVRHPQYLSFILIGVGLSLVAQHWAVVVLGLIVALTSALLTVDEEHALIERFGPAYTEYCRRVPRLDAATGLLRYLRRTRHAPGTVPHRHGPGSRPRPEQGHPTLSRRRTSHQDGREGSTQGGARC